jgi:hypothetical protein
MITVDCEGYRRGMNAVFHEDEMCFKSYALS